MKRIGYPLLLSVAAFVVTAAVAAASPAPTSAVLNERVFNDCSGSMLTSTNSYPALISFDDVGDPMCTGFANLHNWRFSENGVDPVLFSNGDIFRFSADLVIDGAGQCESGIQISPWWSQNVEGRINVRTTDGEIAMFGGVLPFYNFSANTGIFYQKGQPIHLEMNYEPHSNTMADPGTLEGKITYGGIPYSSGVLPFTNFNAAEDPIYHSYGIMEMAQAGGHIQVLWQAGQNQEATATWTNIQYFPDAKPTPTETSSWGRIKSIYR